MPDDRIRSELSWTEIALAIGSVVTLLIGAIALGIGAWQTGDSGGGETFRFIALLIIFMAALAMTAGVFAWLRLDNQHEAFGLPTGSVRALLAIGVMILLVVFGLPMVSPLSDKVPDRVSDKPLRTVEVPREALNDALVQYRAQGLVAIVSDYGRTPVALGVAPVQPPATTPPPVRLDLYTKVRARPAEELDLTKQILTAIITLLTTVIGFYFGSRSAADLATIASGANPSGTVTGTSISRGGAPGNPATSQ